MKKAFAESSYGGNSLFEKYWGQNMRTLFFCYFLEISQWHMAILSSLDNNE